MEGEAGKAYISLLALLSPSCLLIPYPPPYLFACELHVVSEKTRNERESSHAGLGLSESSDS